MRSRRRIDRSSIIAHPLNFDIQRERSLKCDAKTWHICIYHPLYNLYGFSLSIGNTNVATLTCLGWLLKYFNYSCPQADVTRMRTSYLIDGSFKFEVDPHQFNLRLQHFSQFQRKKIKSWQVCDWLAKWLIALRFMDLSWLRVYRRSNVSPVIVINYFCTWIWYVVNVYKIIGVISYVTTKLSEHFDTGMVCWIELISPT